MRGVFGRPWLDLDDLVPLQLLDEEGIDLELATAPRYNNVWGMQFPRDFSNYFIAPADASPRVKEFYEKHAGNIQARQNFAKLWYGVYSPTWSVRLTDMDARLNNKIAKDFQLFVDDAQYWTRIPNTFPSVFRFIDEGGVFESTGRITFFITDHNCSTPLHNDYAHDQSNGRVGFNAEAEKEFVWLSLKSKSFYIWDDMRKVKHHVTSKSAWFNTLDLHGGDAVLPQTWSLRIDGKFTTSFRQKLAEKFGKKDNI